MSLILIEESAQRVSCKLRHLGNTGLEEGVGLAEILADFPTLDRGDVLMLLREAHSLVVGQELRRAAE